MPDCWNKRYNITLLSLWVSGKFPVEQDERIHNFKYTFVKAVIENEIRDGIFIRPNINPSDKRSMSDFHKHLTATEKMLQDNKADLTLERLSADDQLSDSYLLHGNLSQILGLKPNIFTIMTQEHILLQKHAKALTVNTNLIQEQLAYFPNATLTL